MSIKINPQAYTAQNYKKNWKFRPISYFLTYRRIFIYIHINSMTIKQKEEMGRRKVEEILNKYHVYQITTTQDPYCHWDLSYTGKSTIANVEIKYRIDYPSTAFDSVILQKDKYDWMMEEYQKDPAHIPLYWTLWNDNVSWVVDITKLNPKWEWKALPKNNEGNEMTWKQVCYINFSEEGDGKWKIQPHNLEEGMLY